MAPDRNGVARRPHPTGRGSAADISPDITGTWRRFIAAFNANSIDEVAEFIDERFVDHHLPADLPSGIAGLRTWWNALHDAFDLRLDVEDIVVGVDRLASRMTFRAVHMGTFRGHPPTGKGCVATVMSLERFDHGRLVERWQVGDEVSMLEQLGILEAR